jgi:histidinol phosphatase-like enzyme
MLTVATSIGRTNSSSFELARFWTNELQWLIVVVTNQSGIGRGYFDESTMKT